MSSLQRVLIKDGVCDIQFSIKKVLWRVLSSCLNHFLCHKLILEKKKKSLHFMETLILFDCLNLRLDAPSSPGSSTSSSWLPSPGCVLRGSSCTSCSWRSLRANTPGKSTTTSRVTSSPPSWLASPQPSTTRATGPRKRECSFPEQIREMQSRTMLDATLRGPTCCVSMWQLFEKKSTHHFCQRLTCLSGDSTKNI